jgi:glutathione S-transferase
MIDLYYWPTPNGDKIAIFLEEAGLEYQFIRIDIFKNEQFSHSIADMAIYPWVALYEWQSQNIDDFPEIKRWLLNIQKRPAVQRAYIKGGPGGSH